MANISPGGLTEEALSQGRKARRVGRRIILLNEVDSTNAYALRTLAAQEGAAADGTVIFAERQTAGRGRLGRTWHSPTGASLMFTTLLWDVAGRWSPMYLVMAAGVAVVRGIAAATDVEPMLRWPNDVYVEGRKLAGILVEAKTMGHQEWAVAIGIGVNCLQHAGHFAEEIRERAISLEMASSEAIDRAAVGRAILSELDKYFSSAGTINDAELAAEWQRHSEDIGSRVTLLCDGREFSGRIMDVDPQQGLVVQLDDGTRRHFDAATTSMK